MKRDVQAVLPELDRAEMLELVGGEEHPGSSFAWDLGHVLGAIVGHLETLLTTSADTSYINAKVGCAY